MRMLGTTLIVNKGETFTLSKTVINSDGSPYVMYKHWTNPYLLIKVASNVYDFEGKYIHRYWLDASSYPSFVKNKPEYISDLDNGLPAGYSEDYTTFYTIDEDGNRSYYYWNIDKFVPYSFKFNKTFINTDTSKWIESIYQYEILMTSGNKTIDVLQGMYTSLNRNNDGYEIPTDTRTLYYYILDRKPEWVKGVEFNAPLINYNTHDILQKPSKLIIENNI